LVNAVQGFGDSLYVGGNFTMAGGKSIQKIANAPVDRNPWITGTLPTDNENNVPLTESLTIAFSKPMDTTTINFDITPDPGGWSQNWNKNQDTLRLLHNAFDTSTTYTFEVTNARDIYNHPLVDDYIPNPFSFTTSSTVNSIEDNPLLKTDRWEVYSTLTQGHLKLESLTNQSVPVTYKVISLQGVVYKSNRVNLPPEKTHTISTANLTPGIYFIHLTDNAGQHSTHKFVIPGKK
jgi:Flp pilus assembly protein TadG